MAPLVKLFVVSLAGYKIRYEQLMPREESVHLMQVVSKETTTQNSAQAIIMCNAQGGC